MHYHMIATQLSFGSSEIIASISPVCTSEEATRTRVGRPSNKDSAMTSSALKDRNVNNCCQEAKHISFKGKIENFTIDGLVKRYIPQT